MPLKRLKQDICTYTIGKTTGYTYCWYAVDTAVNPNKKIPTTKYSRSNTESAIKRFENDCVNVAVRRFPASTPMLKILPIMPIKETAIKGWQIV